MPQLFQIPEDDLAELERLVPAIADRLGTQKNNKVVRTQMRRLKGILSDIRWRYGPATNVTIIPAGPSHDEGLPDTPNSS